MTDTYSITHCTSSRIFRATCLPVDHTLSLVLQRSHLFPVLFHSLVALSSHYPINRGQRTSLTCDFRHGHSTTRASHMQLNVLWLLSALRIEHSHGKTVAVAPCTHYMVIHICSQVSAHASICYCVCVLYITDMYGTDEIVKKA